MSATRDREIFEESLCGGSGPQGGQAVEEERPAAALNDAPSTPPSPVAGASDTQPGPASSRTPVEEFVTSLQSLQCSICQEPVSDAVQLACTHIFCRECITNSAESSHASANLCPNCRGELYEMSEEEKSHRNFLDVVESLDSVDDDEMDEEIALPDGLSISEEVNAVLNSLGFEAGPQEQE